MNKLPTIWSMSVSLYPGILIGMRTYRAPLSTEYVIYIPFIDISLTIYNAED